MVNHESGMGTGQLAGRVAIVTGGTQGVGRGIALAMAAEGAAVMLSSRTPEKGAAVVAEIEAQGGRAVYVRADVGIKAEAQAVVAETAARFGRLDALVNNAQSQGPWCTLEEKDDEAFAIAYASGFQATLWTMQAAFPIMRRQGGGRIINLGSRRGVWGAKQSADYNAAKEAVRGLSRTAAREWGPYNILVNVVCPAANSPGAEAYFAANPGMAAKILGSIPLRRMGDPVADIGGLVVGLASDDACFITGETFFADGGMNLKRPE